MLEIRDYKNGDEIEIIDLFKDAFHKELSIEHWKWSYDNNYFKDKYIKLMWDENTLAGHYAVIPISLIVNNKLLKTGLSMTTMTSSAYKKRGIFNKLSSNLYSQIYNDVNLIWGFPNDNSLHGFIKYLGWKHIADIYMYRCETYKNIQIDSKIKRISFFDERFDHLFKQIKNNYKVITSRDSQYLNWRYKEHSDNTYYFVVYEKDNNYLGYCIYKIYKENNDKYCDIVDIISINKEIYINILNYIINEMNLIGIKYVNMWLGNNENLEIARKLGFNNTNICTHFGAKINCNCLNEDIYEFSNWYLTMGDSDVF